MKNDPTLIPLTSVEPQPAVTCANCAACCCQLEVILLSDTGVPKRYIDIDQWGGEVMLRLDDGWCVALDRDSMLCTIYENAPGSAASSRWPPPSAWKSARGWRLFIAE